MRQRQTVPTRPIWCMMRRLVSAIHYLYTECVIRILKLTSSKKTHSNPKIGSQLVQLIKMGKFIRLVGVKFNLFLVSVLEKQEAGWSKDAMISKVTQPQVGILMFIRFCHLSHMR